MSEERRGDLPIEGISATGESKEKEEIFLIDDDNQIFSDKPLTGEEVEEFRTAAKDIYEHLAETPSERFKDVTPKLYFQWLKHMEKRFSPEPVEANVDISLIISPTEFDKLNAKTQETIALAALARQRIAKDQEEIDLLKKETRELLTKLRAA